MCTPFITLRHRLMNTSSSKSTLLVYTNLTTKAPNLKGKKKNKEQIISIIEPLQNKKTKLEMFLV